MSPLHLDSLFPAWRQRCLDDGLALLQNALTASGQDGQPGLLEAWRGRFKALLYPTQGAPSAATAVDALSGPQLVWEDEVEEGVLSQQLVQALENTTGWMLSELGTRCSLWQPQAEQVGLAHAMLLSPELLAESLCLALRDCVPRAPRRHQLLRDLSPHLARLGKAMYERLGQWLETQGLENRGMLLSGVRSPNSGADGLAGPTAVAIDPTQVPELLARVAEQAGLDADMRQLLTQLAAPIQRSLDANPTLLESRQHSIWRFVDRLVHLALVDQASPLPDATPLPVRLGPMVQAFVKANAALTSAHYERALEHVERLVAACLAPPLNPARANVAVRAAEQRRAELEPWLQTQLAERLQRQELLPNCREFLQGPWVQVVSRTAAVAGLTADSTQERTAFIDRLIGAADLHRVQPLGQAEIAALVQEARAGLQGIGFLPAVVDGQTQALHQELASRAYKAPRVATALAPTAEDGKPSPMAAVVFSSGEAADRDSSDWMSDDWAHHGDLDTVSMDLPDDGDPGTGASQTNGWLGSLKAGELCRIFLQGRWRTARLDWVSDRQQFYKFSNHGTVFSASRRMLQRMRAEGLITTIEPGHWLRDAVNSMPLDLDLI